MKHSERLAERNDILLVINQIDDDLRGLSSDKSFRAASLAREMLETRHHLSRELNQLGFDAPELDERLRTHEVVRPAPAAAAGGGDPVGADAVVAKRRIGPAC